MPAHWATTGSLSPLMKGFAAMSVEIREMTVDDYDSVRSLWEQSEGVGLRECDERAGVASFLKRNPGSSFVACQADCLVGAVLCGHDGRRGYLYHLAVAQLAQRQGIGRRLVYCCLEQLRKAGIDRCNISVYADNDEGKQFWKNRDWFEREDLCVMQTLTPNVNVLVEQLDSKIS